MAKYLLVDGYNMAFRAFYAVKELKRSDGFPTNALYGWVRSMWKLLDDQRPDYVTVFFDLGGAQDKLELLPEYKANRGETPEDFEKQVPIIKELTQSMGFGMVELEGVESDDLLAAYATRLVAKESDAVVQIVSADKDFAQTVTDRIHLLLPPPTANPRLGWRELDAAGVEEKWGLPPEKMIDYLSLIGDTSDNIPGVPGCGPKTAVKWLTEYGDIDGVLENAPDIKPPRFRELLPTLKDRLEINRRIIGFDLTHHDGLELDTGELDLSKLCSILEEMEMKNHHAEALKRYEQKELF